MKYLIFFLAALPFLAPAQGWQNVCSPGVTLYKDQSGEIKAFRLDSIQVPGNGDTISYSYLTIRNKVPCADTTHGSVLGRKIYKTSGGIYFFFNQDNDTLTIDAAASLNKTWKFCDLQGGAYIMATVDSIISDSILGMPDSVKIIGFQAYNSTGNPIGHLMNSYQIRLGKLYGLSEIADIYMLPDSLAAFSLAGKTSLELGILNLDAYEVYNFDIGDEFHYKSSFSYGYGPGSYSETSIKILKILEKEIFGSTDSIIYHAERCINAVLYPHSSPPVVTLTHDTIEIRYDFTDPENNSLTLRMPGEYVPSWASPWSHAKEIRRFTTGPNGRQKQTICPTAFLAQWPSSCWSIYGPSTPLETFGQGLGKMGYKVFNMIYNNWDYDSLRYYIKGEETWGIPVAIDCNALLTTTDQPSDHGLHIFISPNPVRDKLKVIIEGPETGVTYGINIIDLLGRVIFKTNFQQSPFIMPRPELPKGLYIWQVTGAERTATGKLILE